MINPSSTNAIISLELYPFRLNTNTSIHMTCHDIENFLHRVVPDIIPYRYHIFYSEFKFEVLTARQSLQMCTYLLLK